MIFSSLLGSNNPNEGSEEYQNDASNAVSYSQLKFQTCEDVEQYFKEYAQANNFAMRRGGSRSEKGQKIMQLFECSASRVNRKSKSGDHDERAVHEAERKRTEAHCCKWRSRAWRKYHDETESYYWYISSWNNEHSHDISIRRNTPENVSERRDPLSEKKKKKDKRDIIGGETVDGTEGQDKVDGESTEATVANHSNLKVYSEQKIQRIQKKRYSILLSICKEWCGINAESEEAFDRAHTLMSNDLSVAQVELLDLQGNSSSSSSNLLSHHSLSDDHNTHHYLQQHNLLDAVAEEEASPLLPSSETATIEHPSASSESVVAGGKSGENKKRKRKDTVTELPSSTTSEQPEEISHLASTSDATGDIPEIVISQEAEPEVDEEDVTSSSSVMMPHKKRDKKASINTATTGSLKK